MPEYKSSCVLDMLEEVRSLNHIETAQILVRLFLGRGKIEYFMDYLIERDIENCRESEKEEKECLLFTIQ